MRIRSIRGHGIEDVNNEIGKAIEERYPIKEGKPFITVYVVYEHIKETSSNYPLIATQEEKFLKSLLTQYCEIKQWARYTKNRGGSKSPVYVRDVSGASLITN